MVALPCRPCKPLPGTGPVRARIGKTYWSRHAQVPRWNSPLIAAPQPDWKPERHAKCRNNKLIINNNMEIDQSIPEVISREWKCRRASIEAAPRTRHHSLRNSVWRFKPALQW